MVSLWDSSHLKYINVTGFKEKRNGLLKNLWRGFTNSKQFFLWWGNSGLELGVGFFCFPWAKYESLCYTAGFLLTSPLPDDFWLLKTSVPSWVIEFLCSPPWLMYTCTYTQTCAGRIWKPEFNLKWFGICLGKALLPLVDLPSGLSKSVFNYQLHTLLLSGQSLLLTTATLILGAGSTLMHLDDTKGYLLHFETLLNGTLCILE